jgi:hypothetical protein
MDERNDTLQSTTEGSAGATSVGGAVVHFGRIDESLIFGPFAVFLVRDGRTTAQCTGCETRMHAAAVARDYLQTFGATTLREWTSIGIRASDGTLVACGPIPADKE